MEKRLEKDNDLPVNTRAWSIGEARRSFSEVIREAFIRPQIIEDQKATDGADRSVAVISLADLKEFLRLKAGKALSEQEERVRKLNKAMAAINAAGMADGVTDATEILLPRLPPRPLPDFGEGEQ